MNWHYATILSTNSYRRVASGGLFIREAFLNKSYVSLQYYFGSNIARTQSKVTFQYTFANNAHLP